MDWNSILIGRTLSLWLSGTFCGAAKNTYKRGPPLCTSFSSRTCRNKLVTGSLLFRKMPINHQHKKRICPTTLSSYEDNKKWVLSWALNTGSWYAPSNAQYDWPPSRPSSPTNAMLSQLDPQQQMNMFLRMIQPSRERVSALETSPSNATARRTGSQPETSPSPANWTTARLMYTSNTIGR